MTWFSLSHENEVSCEYYTVTIAWDIILWLLDDAEMDNFMSCLASKCIHFPSHWNGKTWCGSCWDTFRGNRPCNEFSIRKLGTDLPVFIFPVLEPTDGLEISLPVKGHQLIKNNNGRQQNNEFRAWTNWAEHQI